MLKYILKFTMDILPSLTATVIGAYIVNHYIVAKPGTDAQPAAAVVSTVEPKKADVKSDPKPSEADVASLSESGSKAKGFSEKAVLEKSAAEAPAQKSADKPVETASLPSDPHRHLTAPRDKVVAKTVVAPPPAVAPVAALPAPSSSVTAAIAPEEHSDANDMVRAAVERLRENSPRAVVASAPTATVVRPLPAPITVSSPTAEQPPPSVSGSAQAGPIYQDATGQDDPTRPTPPADIPPPPLLPPLVLHADASGPGPSIRERPSFADDVLAAARSVFHAVLPK